MSELTYLIDELPNPSTDFFVMPALRRLGGKVVRCGFNDVPDKPDLVGARLVFVRYISQSWRKRVDQVRGDLAALIYFMDDDVLDIAASAGLSLYYRYKLLTLAARHRNWLQKQKPELWVSTPWLMNKYADWAPRLVFPQQIDEIPRAIRLFYHGGGTHIAEARWLRPLVADLLEQDEALSFEITGNESVVKLYRGVPRVTVVRIMKWPAYRHFCALAGRTIGLAPVLDTAFNRARSCTKFFDITRCGAVGLYSKGAVCDEIVEHGVNGYLLPNDPAIWQQQILSLIKDQEMLRDIYAEAVKTTAA